jgi:sec-independent protein translocase protein TatB
MFEVGFTEIILILGLALLVLGPEKLPGLAEKVGRWTGRARAMARQLRTQLEHEVTMEELARSRPAQPATPTPDTGTSAEPQPDPAAYTATGPMPGRELDLDAMVSGVEPAPHDIEAAADAAAADAAADAAVAADVPPPKAAP